MKNLKQEAIQAISTLPENAEIDDIMYRLYVIGQVEKGKEDIKNGKSISVEALEKEIEKW